MATDLTLLLFEVNQLVERIARGDLAAAEALAAKARLLVTVAEEVGDQVAGNPPFDDSDEPTARGPLR